VFPTHRAIAGLLTVAGMASQPCARAAEPSPPPFVFRIVPATPMTLPAPIALGPAAPGAPFQWTGLNQERLLRNVTAPLLYPVRPAAAKSNGQTVLVVPGGVGLTR